LGDDASGLRNVAGHKDLIARGLEIQDQQFPDIRLILNDKHTALHSDHMLLQQAQSIFSVFDDMVTIANEFID
jgi:hypothetical protein